MQTYNILSDALLENNFKFSTEVVHQLNNYLTLLSKWNDVFNLTSIVNPRELVYLHIIDSLIINPFLKGERLLDVGSGAGLPGIPLAIINPEQQWMLNDKNSKKIHFLNQVTAELGLKNVKVMHARCEDIRTDVCFDSIVSRALGTLKLLISVSHHLLCKGGVWLAMKGKYPQEEIESLYKSVNISAYPLRITGINVERHLVSLRTKED